MLDDRLRQYDQRIARICQAGRSVGGWLKSKASVRRRRRLWSRRSVRRQLTKGAVSAWLGLVPREHSSGQRTMLLGSQARQQQLRTLLITGRAATRVVERNATRVASG